MNFMRGVGAFLACLLLYLGLPVLGWGIGDLGGFFASEPNLGYAAVVGVFGLMVGVQASISMEGIANSPGLKEKTVQRQSRIALLLDAVCIAAMFLSPLTLRLKVGVLPGGETVSWLGVFLCMLGYGLILWSGLALGRQYSAQVTLQENHQLITTGPYRLVRHPRYLGLLLMVLGVSLLFRAWIGLACLVAVLVLVLSRIADEEQLLSQAFGEAWSRYARRSRRLIPFLY